MEGEHLVDRAHDLPERIDLEADLVQPLDHAGLRRRRHCRSISPHA